MSSIDLLTCFHIQILSIYIVLESHLNKKYVCLVAGALLCESTYNDKAAPLVEGETVTFTCHVQFTGDWEPIITCQSRQNVTFGPTVKYPTTDNVVNSTVDVIVSRI